MRQKSLRRRLPFRLVSPLIAWAYPLVSWVRVIPGPKEMPLDVRRRILIKLRLGLAVIFGLWVCSLFTDPAAHAYRPIILDYEVNPAYDLAWTNTLSGFNSDIFGKPANAQLPPSIDALDRIGRDVAPPPTLDSLTQAGRAASAEISQNLDRTWNESLVSFYPVLQVSAAIYAVVSIMVMGVRLGKKQMQEGGAAWDELAIPLVLIVILLSPLAVQIPLIARNVANTTNATMLTLTNFNAVFQEANASTSFESSISPEIAACKAADAAEQQDCLEEAVGIAQGLLDEQRGIFGDAPWIARWAQRLAEAGQTLVTDDLSIAGLDRRVRAVQYSILSPVFESVVYGILTASQSGYQLALEVGLLVTALLGPFALALGIGFEGKPAVAWILAMVGMGQAKMLFNAVAGFASTIIVGVQGGVDNLMLPIALVIFGIPLSLALAKGGGIAIWDTFLQIGGSVTGIALKLRHYSR